MKFGKVYYCGDKGSGAFGVIISEDGLLFPLSQKWDDQFSEYVFFDDSSKEPELIIPIDRFDYFNDLKCPTYGDEGCQVINKVRIPDEALRRSERFLLDECYGTLKAYYRTEDVVYLACASHNAYRIISFELRPKSIPNDIDTLVEIDNYLDNLDVSGMINSFTIRNEETFLSRPGRDDYYYIHKIYNHVKDEYIDGLFPHDRITIYEDRGYTSAHSMSINFEEAPYSDEENTLRSEALEKYDKNSHRRFLVREAMSRIELSATKRTELVNLFDTLLHKHLMEGRLGYGSGQNYHPISFLDLPDFSDEWNKFWSKL